LPPLIESLELKRRRLAFERDFDFEAIELTIHTADDVRLS
jgi:hypothetical protein